MRRKVQNSLVLALGLATLVGLAPNTAKAQTPSTQAVTTAAATPSRSTEVPVRSGHEPILDVLGVPVRVNAPVAAPYSGSAYRDFAGQPESSGEAVLARSAHSD